MAENNNSSGDLSTGDITQEQKFLGEILLNEAQQKATFRNFSFYVAWVFSSLFFISVIVFSWKIMFCQSVFLLPQTQTTHPEELNKTTENIQANETPTAKNTIQSVNSAQHPIETENKKNQQGSLINQFLIMIGLLSAVGTTLAIAVMKYSFSNQKTSDKDENATPISPVASSVAECLKQVAELLKLK